MRLFQGMGLAIVAACSLSMASCSADRSVGIAPGALNPVAGMADATGLPPPSVVSPGAATLVDDKAIITAFRGLDLAATAADVIIAARPQFVGTPAARKLADGLDATRYWLNAASKAQRAQQAMSYTAALRNAEASIASAKDALAIMKGK